MANVFQRAIYYLANAVPLAVLTAISLVIQFKSWAVPIVLLVLAIFTTILFFQCFMYAKKNCSIKEINITSISSKDSWLVAYVFAYLFPFAYMVFSDFQIVSIVICIIMLIIVIMPAVMTMPNIILTFAGYHFYEVGTDSTGVSDYLLISKRKRVRNRTDVRNVIRVYEKLLIDAQEER